MTSVDLIALLVTGFLITTALTILNAPQWLIVTLLAAFGWYWKDIKRWWLDD